MSDEAHRQQSGEGAHQTHFDTDRFLSGFDAIVDAHKAAEDAEPYLQQAMVDAENDNDDAGLLTVLNETMGFYRSQGRHQDNQWVIQRALELGLRMHIEGTSAWTTTLINAATGMRAAGRYEQAEDLYRQALDSAGKTLKGNDRSMAALHNNYSMLFSETGRFAQAQEELETALHILSAASVDIDADLDVASTHTNLALVILQRLSAEDNSGGEDNGGESSSGGHDELLGQARQHAEQALAIYRQGHLEHSAHFASALAGFAQVCFAGGQFAQAVQAYRQALGVIEECYGVDTDYYRTTAENLRDAEHALKLYQQHAQADTAASTTAQTPSSTPKLQPMPGPAPTPQSAPTADRQAPGTAPVSGLKLARAYWEQYGKPLLAERYPQYRSRIAAGLVGHGSQCYGFDDNLSHDHDFGPGFCLWLTDADYHNIGEHLQADYEALPRTFMGYGPEASTARAQGAGRRLGVFSIGDFFESITGYRQAPAADKPHEWLLLDEPTLAAATNGQVFADPFGAFLKTRQGFTLMPEDVRLSLISRRLGMIAQAGQYNLPRMLTRGDGAAAWRSINEFVNATTSLVFLLNEPVTAGYMPYYKWQFAALRRLSARMGMSLTDVCEQLEQVLRLSSAACFGGAGFGEGGKGSGPAQKTILDIVEHICSEIVADLHSRGLSDADETFLEWQRPYVEEHLRAKDPVLRSL